MTRFASLFRGWLASMSSAIAPVPSKLSTIKQNRRPHRSMNKPPSAAPSIPPRGPTPSQTESQNAGMTFAQCPGSPFLGACDHSPKSRWKAGTELSAPSTELSYPPYKIAVDMASNHHTSVEYCFSDFRSGAELSSFSFSTCVMGSSFCMSDLTDSESDCRRKSS